MLVLLFWAFHLSCGGVIIYSRDRLEGYTGSLRSNVPCILHFTSVLDYPQEWREARLDHSKQLVIPKSIAFAWGIQ